MEVVKYSAQLRAKEQLTPDVFECQFEKPTGFDYLAGQFVQFLVPHEGKVKALSYSMSSTPTDDCVEFCIKIHEDGIGCQSILKMGPDAILEFQGPRGFFVHKEDGIAVSFIATGTGIAPILSIIRDELENKKNESELRLLFGVRSEEDLFWVERLQTLKEKYINFSYEIALSQPKPNGAWSGLRGRVTEHLLHHLVSHKFYICGNAAMIKDVREMLIKNGVEAKAIHFEVF